MITKIAIKNFKSLSDIDIDCSNLNVFTGLNGMGKSSIIQALLTLRQSYDKGSLQKEGLSLKGELTDIGLGKDVLYQFASTDEIEMALSFLENGDIYKESWTFTYEANEESDENKYSESDIIPYPDDIHLPSDLLRYSLFKVDKFKYLNAERWVKNIYEMGTQQIRNRSLGIHGEYTPHYLVQYGQDNKENSVDSSLLYKGTEVNTLDYQVSAWMNEISPGTKVKTVKIQGVNSVKLSYEFHNDRISTQEISPLNVGFGITYVLPIIVVLLSARPGDIIIIENPESHIHPKGQSIIGKLLAKVANLGVQLFVETHSDHIINGIRVAVKQGVPADLINLVFFIRGENHDEIYSTYNNPKIDQDGRIDFWPKDFFDEWNNNLMELL
jgi:predicted ATPase